jgi:uncharacterized membrane protein YgcG
MNMPSFSGEASLYKTNRHYHMAVSYRQVAESILPSQATHPTRGRATWPPEETVPFRPTTPQASHCWWGHWCGPNCGGGTPQDDLDRCCRAHDECYGTGGPLGPCSCDAELIACAAPKVLQFWDPQKAAAAAAIVSIFTTKIGSGLCDPFGGGGGGGGGSGGGGGTIGNGSPRRLN